MERFLEQLAALPALSRLGILLGALLLVGAGYYQFFYSDLVDERARLASDIVRLEGEKHGHERRKRQYLAYRKEVDVLAEEQKELLRALPKKDDIEQFIEGINAQVEVAGLSRVASVRDPATTEEMYLRIPIKMSLVGTYHQINRFFKNVGELRRIVAISDLQLKRMESNTPPLAAEATVLLRADFVALTFQYVEGGAPKAAPGGKP